MAPPATGPVRVAIVGAAFTANRGSASMLQAVIEGLPGVLAGAGAARECRFAVLTTYPQEDRAYAAAVHPGVRVVPYRPWELIFPLLPLALRVAAARALGVPPRFATRFTLHPALREIARADVVVDVAGISFVDGRGLSLVAYNVLMTGIPRLLGARVVKCAQALGPFRTRLNRTAARAVLPRLAAVVARGEAPGRTSGSWACRTRRAPPISPSPWTFPTPPGTRRPGSCGRWVSGSGSSPWCRARWWRATAPGGGSTTGSGWWR